MGKGGHQLLIGVLLIIIISLASFFIFKLYKPIIEEAQERTKLLPEILATNFEAEIIQLNEEAKTIKLKVNRKSGGEITITGLNIVLEDNLENTLVDLSENPLEASYEFTVI